MKNAAGEATKKRPVFGRLLSLSATYFQQSPWLLRVSGETRWAARNSQVYHSNVPSINSTHISTYTEAIYTNSTNLGAVVSLP